MSSGTKLETKARDIFKKAGFHAVWTRGKEFVFNNDSLQIDVICIWENVCVLIETTGQDDSIGQKMDRFSERCRLLVNHDLLIPYLEFLNSRYNFGIEVDRFRISNPLFVRLFIATKPELETLRGKGNALNPEIFVWDRDLLEYFKLLSKAITEFAKYEMLGFFRITPDRISGEPSDPKTVDAVKLIAPDKGQVIYTFTIKVKDLLEMSKVIRKDGWESDSFQRLVRNKKLDKIRNYLLEGGNFFPNNIIVSLPQDVVFQEVADNPRLGILSIPRDFGSITIIDGQHRLLGYTRCNNAEYSRATGKSLETIKDGDDRLRKIMEDHRLIVTGMEFPEENEAKERAQIFVEINDNQTGIPKALIYALSWDLLGHKYPEAFASCILDQLNSDGIFKERIRIKEFQTNRIPKTSIIRYALRYFVDASRGELYGIAPQWVKEAYGNEEYAPFIDHCVTLINQYFKQIVSIFSPSESKNSPWKDLSKERYMLTSVTSIVAFLKLLRHFFYWNGEPDTDRFFKKRRENGASSKPRVLLKARNVKAVLKTLSKISFEKGANFPYRSSQWGWLEADMLKKIRKHRDYGRFGKVSLVSKKWAEATGLV